MGQLIYVTNTSLDGYIEDDSGNFDWTEPSDEVHAFINELIRPIETHVYGRRLYETMEVWETDPSFASGPPVQAEFATIWKSAEKVVYSSTLTSPSTERTRIEPKFDPEAVRVMKEATDGTMLIGGAELAAEAFRAGLIDECQLFVLPVVVGGGKRALPLHRVDLDLLDHRRFANGTVYLRYAVRIV